MSDKIDLYSDRGVLLKSDVDLSAVSPLKNAAMQRLIALTKRTVAVNLAGIEKVHAVLKARRVLPRLKCRR